MISTEGISTPLNCGQRLLFHFLKANSSAQHFLFDLLTEFIKALIAQKFQPFNLQGQPVGHGRYTRLGRSDDILTLLPFLHPCSPTTFSP